MIEKTNDVMSEYINGKACVFYKKNQPEVELIIRMCKADEAEDILKLQQKVYDKIFNKEIFVMTTNAELYESLIQDVCLGAYDDGKLIAFTLMISNRYNPRNLGHYLDYNEEDCQKSVTNDTTFVDPDYKGYGLQRFFIGLKEELAIKLGAVEVFATVSPDNFVSLNNVLSNGFEIVTQMRMYGGYDRYILRKSLL